MKIVKMMEIEYILLIGDSVNVSALSFTNVAVRLDQRLFAWSS